MTGVLVIDKRDYDDLSHCLIMRMNFIVVTDSESNTFDVVKDRHTVGYDRNVPMTMLPTYVGNHFYKSFLYDEKMKGSE